jgi:hypothetical protein
MLSVMVEEPLHHANECCVENVAAGQIKITLSREMNLIKVGTFCVCGGGGEEAK